MNELLEILKGRLYNAENNLKENERRLSIQIKEDYYGCPVNLATASNYVIEGAIRVSVLKETIELIEFKIENELKGGF